jgi:predicted nuclease of restriction endonuclease-like RecB superfamily
MLTADLVDARRKNGELLLRPLDREGRAEALAIGASLLDAASAHVGRRREELEDAWDEAIAAGARPKLAAGLRKLVADACVFEAETEVDPIELRRVLFTHASEARRARDAFDRAEVLAEAAKILGLAADTVERAMFADLRSEHLLRAAPTLDAASIVEAWELGQAQAVLLTAVRITCEIASASPGLVRAFFARLKFHKLLFSVERIGGGAFRVVIDGPYSMFDAVTKYGLRLALALPALRSLERWSLVADVRWGKAREALVFRLASDADVGARDDRDVHLADDVRELLEAIDAQGNPWRARPASALLDVPGEGVCIPDLELTKDGETVFVEVLGFWSRDAVWRRVEWAARGLGAKVVFAVSSRLRVSAEVLDDAAPASLYVYKGKMSPRAVLEHAERLAAR